MIFPVFLAALALYGALGSPTPDAPGAVEALILAGLALAALGGGLRAQVVRAAWFRPLSLLLAYGLAAGAVMGALHGAAAADMIRDMIAFAALAVPVAFYGLFDTPGRARTLVLAMLGVGLAFSARYLWSLDILLPLADRDFLYLANSPLVPFAATWLALHAAFVERHKVRTALCAGAALIPLLAMAGMMQRATLILFAFVFAGFWIANLRANPKRALIVLLLLAALGGLFATDIGVIALGLLNKAETVGWNARDAELAALRDTLSQGALQSVFGAGWGALFKSPAVGEQWVRFSHSLMTSLWWKTGWTGLLLGLAAFAALITDTVRRLRGVPVLLAALLVPLGPALFLYGSYKSLCFGLLLLGMVRADWTTPPKGDNQSPA